MSVEKIFNYGQNREKPLAQFHIFVEVFLPSFSSLSLNHQRKVVACYKQTYVHEVLVNRLFKLARKNVVTLVELTVPPLP